MPPSARKRGEPRTQRARAPAETAPGARAKPAQRERLVNAMIELCARSGYQAVSVAQLSSHAGVSSATFYEQFEDKEDCLLAAYEAARARVLAPVAGEDCPSSWAEAARASLMELSTRLQGDPDAGTMVFVEALAGEARMRARREQVLSESEASVAACLDSQAPTLDVPVAALEGARRYVISRHLRTHSVDLLPRAVEDLVVWLGRYEVASSVERWSGSSRAQFTAAEARRFVQLPEQALAPPPRLPRGRHNLPPALVARSRRARILAGTAEVMLSKGYANTSITDIVAAAGIARDVFYEHFENKQHVFLETQQFVTQAVLELCGSAYFGGRDWPERVWLGLGSLLGLVAAYPALAYVRIVECYAAGPVAVRGTEELLRTAALFLEEGYSYGGPASGLPKTASLAIAGAVFEVIYRLVARGEAQAVPRRLPELAYIAIAPFAGTEAAVEIIEGYRSAP